MRLRRSAFAVWLALLLGGCATDEPKQADTRPPPPTKGFPGPAAEIQDSAYLPVDRASRPPPGYGLYTVLLARGADRNTLKLLSELLRTTVGAQEAVQDRINLNLITLPVKQVSEATRILATARAQPDAAAGSLMQRSYDYGQATALMASLCHASRGAAVLKACGSQSPDGPLLVTALKPLDRELAAGQPLLIVNLSRTPPEAVREVLAAYRRQIQNPDFADRREVDSWRLQALNHLLDAAQLLPGISKAYAASK